jgi:hypothetical protein
MTYQYLPHRPEHHRDVAHWRGARDGMRVLSLPSCQGWLRRQANDASYDFWPDICTIGDTLVRERRAAPSAPVHSQAVYVMQKESDGEWAVDHWTSSPAARPPAANAAMAADAETGAADASGARAERTAPEAVTSFIIELSRAERA